MENAPPWELHGYNRAQTYGRGLRQLEERYRTIIEDNEEGYYEADLQGNFTFASDSICATLGYTREELIGMSYKNYVPNEQFDYVYNIFKKVYETGKPINIL